MTKKKYNHKIKQELDGSFEARLGGTHPVDCMKCDETFTFEEALEIIDSGVLTIE